MELTQTYAASSAASPRGEGLRFSLATENARPGVRLEALVRHSSSYGRVMRALHRVVQSHTGFEAQNYGTYQEWVQGQYLQDPAVLALMNGLEELQKEREELGAQLVPLDARASELHRELRIASGGRFIADGGHSDLLWQAKERYWRYLHKTDKALWWVLDPVVSVHPDAALFEAFSRDESSYACVRVPMENLETLGEVAYGTTNVDYSQALADEMARVRDYRPAFLGVGSDGLTLQTAAGTRVEKKIDLPPSWVRGFLQVQSASALASLSLRLSATTLAEVLRHLKARREKEGPRSLRFHLVPGEFPTVEIEPWGLHVREGRFRYQGPNAQDVRVWGRRRLLALDEILPFAGAVEVRLLGDGLPSFWSLELEGHRFEMGLSGWTENNWSQSARFDLLASSQKTAPRDLELAAKHLEAAWLLSTTELSEQTGWSRARATSALQALCCQGQALFDATIGSYRFRPLFPFPIESGEEDAKAASARRWVEAEQVGVEIVSPSEIEADAFLSRAATGAVRLVRARVQTEGGQFSPLLALDADGRATFFQCTCADFRRDKGRGGPCGHVLATFQALLLPELPKIEVLSATSTRGKDLPASVFSRDHGYVWKKERVATDARGVYVILERGEPLGIPGSKSYRASTDLTADLRLLGSLGVEIPLIVGFRRSEFRPARLGDGWKTYEEWLREVNFQVSIPDEWIWWHARQRYYEPIPRLNFVLGIRLTELLPSGGAVLKQLSIPRCLADGTRRVARF